MIKCVVVCGRKAIIKSTTITIQKYKAQTNKQSNETNDTDWEFERSAGDCQIFPGDKGEMGYM